MATKEDVASEERQGLVEGEEVSVKKQDDKKDGTR